MLSLQGRQWDLCNIAPVTCEGLPAWQPYQQNSEPENSIVGYSDQPVRTFRAGGDRHVLIWLCRKVWCETGMKMRRQLQPATCSASCALSHRDRPTAPPAETGSDHQLSIA